MTDIVERLRENANSPAQRHGIASGLMLEAADELERARETLEAAGVFFDASGPMAYFYGDGARSALPLNEWIEKRKQAADLLAKLPDANILRTKDGVPITPDLPIWSLIPKGSITKNGGFTREGWAVTSHPLPAKFISLMGALQGFSTPEAARAAAEKGRGDESRQAEVSDGE